LGAARQYNIGAVFADVNNDGNLDLIVVGNTPRNHLFINHGDGTFRDATDQFAARDYASAHTPIVGDVDNDGGLDLFLVRENREYSALFENLTVGNHWIPLHLRRAWSSQDAIGARVTVRANGRTQVRDLAMVGGCFAGQSDPRLHFGLGTATQVDWIEVRWPSGRLMTFSGAAVGAVDRTLRITEDSAAWLVRPRLTAVGFEFTIHGTPGRKYQLLHADTPAPGRWSSSPAFTLEAPTGVWTDPLPDTPGQRYYRVQVLPP
jgi:hypothetical protein